MNEKPLNSLTPMETKFFPGVKSFVTVNGLETGMNTKDHYGSSISDAFCVKEFKLKEYFCKLYEMDIIIDSSFVNYSWENFSYTFDPADYAKFLNQTVVLTIMIDPEPNPLLPKIHQRTISGLITGFDFEYIYNRKKTEDHSLIKLNVKPCISIMDFVKKNFIFTNVSIANIFENLFKKYNIKPNYKYISSSVKSVIIPFKIQYQETDFQFFVRLCQENKLYFYLSYDTKGNENITIADTTNSNNLIPIKGGKKSFEVLYSYEDFIVQNSFQQIMYPSFKSGLQTENIEPHLEWPLQWPNGQMVLQFSFLRQMVFPGNLISLKNPDSPTDPPEEMFVVSSTTTMILDAKKQQCLAHEILFHPLSYGIGLLAQIQKPKLYGVQYALVVGQSDKAETSSINDTSRNGGTVCVHLYLEQDPSGSRVYSVPPEPTPTIAIHVPVGQTFGGQSGQSGYCGAWWMPRVGQVVIVDFYNGDPDYPVITGTVYNAQNTNNSWVPGGKNLIPTYTTYDAVGNPIPTQLTPAQFAMVTCTTPSGKTGSVFLFDDKADATAPQIYMSTNGNSSFVSLNNKSITVIKGNYVTKVGTEENTSTMTFDNKGNLTIDVPGNVLFHAGKDMTFTCQNFNLAANMNVNIKASQNINMNSNQSTTIKAGTVMDVEGGNSCTVKGGMSLELSSAQVTMEGSIQTEVKGAIVNVTATGPTAVKGAVVELN